MLAHLRFFNPIASKPTPRSLPPLNHEDIIDFFNQVVLSRTNGRHVVVHSDNEPIFCAHDVMEFAKEYHIQISRQTPKSFGNQCSERLNKTIKQKIREILLNQK